MPLCISLPACSILESLYAPHWLWFIAITVRNPFIMIRIRKMPAMATWSNVCQTFGFSGEKRYLHIFIRPVDAYSHCVTKFEKFVSYGKFTTVLNQIYKLNTTKASIHTTIAYSLIFYYFIPACVSSAAANYLSRVSTVFALPLFLSTLIMKAGLEVRTSTTEEGGIRGTTECSHTVTDVTLLLLTLDFQKYLSLIKTSPFSSYTDKRDYNLVLLKIQSTLPGFTGCYDADKEGESAKSTIVLDDTESLYFQMFGFFTVLPSIFHSSINRLEVYDFKLERGFSRLVNIHRFRNTLFADQFIVNAHSISGLADTTKFEFACFIKLFNPVFYQGEARLISNACLLANEVYFDLSAVTDEHALAYLFELKKVGGSSNGGPKVGTRGGISNEHFADVTLTEEGAKNVKQYRDKFLNNKNLKIISQMVTNTVLEILAQTQLASISKLDMGDSSIYYYSPNTLKVSVGSPNLYNSLDTG